MLASKIIGALLAPLSLVLLLLLVAGILLAVQWRRTGYAAAATSLALLLLLSSEPVARGLLSPLESRYPPLQDAAALGDIRWVVVLGSSATGGADHPATTRLSGVAALRLIEGLRVHHALPDSRLILSGGSVFGGAPSGTVMSRAARELGVPAAQLVIHPDPRNTHEEALRIRDTVGEEPFVLVTSASHMPRAMALCKHAGLQPIPAPTSWRTLSNQRSGDVRRFLPSASALAMSERAFHEYLGLLWARMQGQA